MRHWRTSVGGVSSVRGVDLEGEVGEREIGEGVRTFVQVGAVMVCFDAAARVGGVDVECVEVGADLLDGAEVLVRWASISFCDWWGLRVWLLMDTNLG